MSKRQHILRKGSQFFLVRLNPVMIPEKWTAAASVKFVRISFFELPRKLSSVFHHSAAAVDPRQLISNHEASAAFTEPVSSRSPSWNLFF